MTPERWRQVQSAFARALEAEATDRRAVLADACAGDDDLRREVESPLAAHETPGVVDRLAADVISPAVAACAASRSSKRAAPCRITSWSTASAPAAWAWSTAPATPASIARSP